MSEKNESKKELTKQELRQDKIIRELRRGVNNAIDNAENGIDMLVLVGELSNQVSRVNTSINIVENFIQPLLKKSITEFNKNVS